MLILRKVAHQVANYANYVARRLQQQGLLVAIDTNESVSPPGAQPAVSIMIAFRLISAEEGALRRLRKYAYDRSGKGKRLAREEEEALRRGEDSIGEYERGGETEDT